MVLNDSVTKQVRNSYEYSRDSAGFGLSRRDTVPNSLRCAITCRNTANIDHELVKNTPNAARIGHELTEIQDDSPRFARFSLTIVIKRPIHASMSSVPK